MCWEKRSPVQQGTILASICCVRLNIIHSNYSVQMIARLLIISNAMIILHAFMDEALIHNRQTLHYQLKLVITYMQLQLLYSLPPHIIALGSYFSMSQHYQQNQLIGQLLMLTHSQMSCLMIANLLDTAACVSLNNQLLQQLQLPLHQSSLSLKL